MPAQQRRSFTGRRTSTLLSPRLELSRLLFPGSEHCGLVERTRSDSEPCVPRGLEIHWNDELTAGRINKGTVIEVRRSLYWLVKAFQQARLRRRNVSVLINKMALIGWAGAT